MHAHVLTQRTRMRVTLIAAFYATIIRLVVLMNVHVLLAIGTVRKSAIASLILTFKRLLAYSHVRDTDDDNKVHILVIVIMMERRRSERSKLAAAKIGKKKNLEVESLDEITTHRISYQQTFLVVCENTR